MKDCISSIVACKNPPVAILPIFNARHMFAQFKWYQTSLPCHSSRHDPNLQEINHCFYIWELGNSSTIYISVASTRVCKVYFVHSQKCLLLDSFETLPELTTSWCSILWTVWIHAFLNHGGWTVLPAINWSQSSLYTPAVHHIVSCQLTTSKCIHSHPM
jgi:hypothetical protein